MNKSLSIIIPVRAGGDSYITLESLGRSTFQDFSITIFQDTFGNANKARNAGFALAPASEFVLFSDDDIRWNTEGIGSMIEALEKDKAAAFSYGTYCMGGLVYCAESFDEKILLRKNLASTMSVIRTEVLTDGPIEWDELLERLQDHDFWLQVVKHDGYGVHCGRLIFTTDLRDGITRNGKVSYQEAFERLKVKHGLR